MNEVLEKMKSRRSIRSYQPDAVPQELLDQIIEAGLYAASGKGTQNTIILQVTNQELRDEIAKKNCEIGGWLHTIWDSAAAGFIVPKRNLKQNGEKRCFTPLASKRNTKASVIVHSVM